MVCYSLLIAYERARIAEIRDLLVELYVDRSHALAIGMPVRAKSMDREIADLLEEKADIEKSAAVA
jgi:hypothetical protein